MFGRRYASVACIINPFVEHILPLLLLLPRYDSVPIGGGRSAGCAIGTRPQMWSWCAFHCRLRFCNCNCTSMPMCVNNFSLELQSKRSIERVFVSSITCWFRFNRSFCSICNLYWNCKLICYNYKNKTFLKTRRFNLVTFNGTQLFLFSLRASNKPG